MAYGESVRHYYKIISNRNLFDAPRFYWHANRLIICLCLAEKDFRWWKDDGKIKNQTNLDTPLSHVCTLNTINLYHSRPPSLSIEH